MKKILVAVLTMAMVLSNGIMAFAAPETTQMSEPTPLLGSNDSQQRADWVNLPETVYYSDVKELIDCNTNGNPTAKYIYNKDNTLIYWYSYEYNANGNLVARYKHQSDGSIQWSRFAPLDKYEYDASGNLIAQYT